MHDKALIWLNRLPVFVLTQLSFFIDIPLKEIHSEISGKLYVRRAGGRIVVDTDLVNYSHGSLHQVFQRAFKKINPFENKDISHVLVLGFGAGSIYQILRKEQHFKGIITGIELDPTMINLFQEFHGNDDPLLDLRQQDAFEFVQMAEVQYDLIVIDLFVQDDVPDQFFTTEFVGTIQLLLAPNAFLIWNLILTNESHQHKFILLKDKWMRKGNWFKIGDANVIIYQQGPIS